MIKTLTKRPTKKNLLLDNLSFLFVKRDISIFEVIWYFFFAVISKNLAYLHFSALRTFVQFVCVLNIGVKYVLSCNPSMYPVHNNVKKSNSRTMTNTFFTVSSLEAQLLEALLLYSI